MKPTEDLIHEHKAIKTMLSIMSKIAENIRNDKGFDIKDVEKIVDFLKTFADKCHHGKEENALFPALVAAGVPKENGMVGVMLYEHTVGRGYIKEISNGIESFKIGVTNSGQLIADSLAKYVTLLQNHIQKEENVLFPMAEKVLSTEKQNEIFEQSEKIEEDVVGHGVHEQFHEFLEKLKSKYLGYTL
jgi:hemerythrin-like domain-containing protein